MLLVSRNGLRSLICVDYATQDLVSRALSKLVGSWSVQQVAEHCAVIRPHFESHGNTVWRLVSG